MHSSLDAVLIVLLVNPTNITMNLKPFSKAVLYPFRQIISFANYIQLKRVCGDELQNLIDTVQELLECSRADAIFMTIVLLQAEQVSYSKSSSSLVAPAFKELYLRLVEEKEGEGGKKIITLLFFPCFLC